MKRDGWPNDLWFCVLFKSISISQSYQDGGGCGGGGGEGDDNEMLSVLE